MKANELKVEELMVGDWVICHHPTCKPEQMQVTTGLLFNLEQQELGFITEESPLYRIVEPIPLTTEILEAKGFEPRDEHFYLSEDYYDIDIWEYSDGIWIVRYDCCEMNMPSEIWTISYLYELQQFMRHCKIDKTIEL